MSTAKKKSFLLYLTKELKDRLFAGAHVARVSQTELVNQCLERYLDRTVKELKTCKSDQQISTNG